MDRTQEYRAEQTALSEAQAKPVAEQPVSAAIVGTEDNDKLGGTYGNDAIFGGGGDDALFGGQGDDTLSGGAGNDRLFGGEGADTFRIGADGGNDQIADFSLRDGDRIELSFRDLTSFDQLQGRMGAQDDGTIIKFDDGATVFLRGVSPDSLTKENVVFATPENVVVGTNDNDKLAGTDGNDAIYGGEGRDVLFGGAGDDTLSGGGGDDTLYGGEGADTFVFDAGGQSDLIADFSPKEGDQIALSVPGLTSFDQIAGNMGAYEGGTIIKFEDGSTLFIQGVSPESLTKDSFTFDPPVCFHTGTAILTPRGPCPVEELRPGDLVMTRDHGPQPLLWVTRSLHGPPEPPETWQSILIAPGALGPGIPGRPLRLSPQHRVMVIDPATGAEVLVAARKLVERRGIRALRGQRSADYVHLLLERHALLWAEGAAAETMLVAPASRHRLPPDLLARLPDMQPARPILRTDPALRARCAPKGTAVRFFNGRTAPAATPTATAP